MSKEVIEALKPLLAKIDPALGKLTRNEIGKALGYVPAGTEVSDEALRERWEDDVILRIIPEGARVLDLGCGDGQLLEKLHREKNVSGQGVELNQADVFAAIARGVPVLQIDLDEGLKELTNDCFDYVVLEETLQTLNRPTAMLQEMLRVGRRGIVSFPNFGYWKVRLDLLLSGRMPVTESLPYRWYDTPNIHLLCLQDFLDWVKQQKVKIAEAHVLADGEVRPMRDGDNLYAEQCLLVVER